MRLELIGLTLLSHITVDIPYSYSSHYSVSRADRHHNHRESGLIAMLT